MDGNKKITGIVCACIIALALTACKVQPRGYVSLYIDNLTSVNDTFDPVEAPLNMVNTATAHVVDTTTIIESDLPVLLNPAEEILTISSDSIYMHEVERLLKVLIDSVQLSRYHIIGLRKHLTEMPDTSFTGEMLQDFQPTNSQQADYLNQQLLKSKDEQIQMLQNQLSEVRNAPVRTPQQTNISRAPAQVQPLSSRQTDQLTLQLFQAQNDTIQFLRSQLRNLQPQPHKRDSAYLGEAKEKQPENRHVTTQKATDLQALHDSIQLLKTLVISLEQQTLPGKVTPALANQVDRDAPSKAKSDTTLIVAFYERGEIKPLGEESVLKQIKELCSNKDVTKITLSGYTDSSGSEIINKEITNRRLNYLSELIIPCIAKEKIFFQNFGDIFASDTMVSNERRIEIRILTK